MHIEKIMNFALHKFFRLYQFEGLSSNACIYQTLSDWLKNSKHCWLTIITITQLYETWHIKIDFKLRISLGLAHQEHLRNLRVACQIDFEFLMTRADRSVCPRKHDYGCLYADFQQEKFGGKNKELMFQALDAWVK